MGRFPGCMLADLWEGWPEVDAPDYFIVEPKLDGFRLSVVIDHGGEVSFHCREEQEPIWAENLAHVRADVEALGLRGVMLDGEVMASDWNDTSRLLRKFRENMSADEADRLEREVRFHVFDYVELAYVRDLRKPNHRKAKMGWDVSLRGRRDLLRESSWFGRSIQLGTAFEARSEFEVRRLFEEFIDLGFEGAIVKDPRAPYVFSRSPAWRKVKPHRTFDLTVVSFVAGAGKHAGRLGALVGEDAEGQRVRVGTGFSDELREELWEHRDQLAGLVLEAKAQTSGVATARHPRFLRFREEVKRLPWRG